MKFSVEKGDYGTLLDANGNKIHDAVRCDTVTGLVECLVREQGRFVPDPEREGQAKTEVRRYPAPLEFRRR